MAARCASALIGGYAAASGLASLLARLLPVARVEATSWGMILSFPIYAGLLLWAFHEPRLSRVVAALWGSAAACAAAVIVLGPRP
jgi:hypothetical protein